jgi:hypothetical protein
MSKTYGIACVDCECFLWIAQKSAGSQSLYYGDHETMNLLREFLFTHEGHNLTFQNTDLLDYFHEIERPGTGS